MTKNLLSPPDTFHYGTACIYCEPTHLPRKEATMNPSDPPQAENTDEQLLAEDLIEEVSIDGMCGVY
jgi:mycofactocin precursor